jgi:hypothetical protein
MLNFNVMKKLNWTNISIILFFIVGAVLWVYAWVGLLYFVLSFIN